MALLNEYTLIVDLKREVTNPIPVFVEGDSTVIKFTVEDNGEPFDLSSVTNGTITTKLPNEQIVIGNLKNENGVLEYTFGIEMRNAGLCESKLQFYSGQTRITTRAFAVMFDDDWTDGDGQVPSQTIITELTNKVNGIDNRLSEIERSSSNTHTHGNLNTLAKILYTGIKANIDLKAIEDNTANTAALQTTVSSKADKSEVNSLSNTLAGKADKSEITALQNALESKADVSTIIDYGAQIAGKADISAVAQVASDLDALETDKADKAELESAKATLQASVDAKADKATVDTLTAEVNGKAASVHQHPVTDITGLQTIMDTKANATHTHDERYSLKSETYTKAEADNKLTGDIVELPNGVKIGAKSIYNNLAGATSLYVRFLTIAVDSGNFERAFVKLDLYNTGSTIRMGTFETLIYHSSAYNAVRPEQYYQIYNTGGRHGYTEGDIQVVKTDDTVGKKVTYDFYAKLPSYGKLYTNILTQYKEFATIDLLPLLDGSPILSTTAPIGAENVPVTSTGGTKIKQNLINNTADGTSAVAHGITGFNAAADTLFIYYKGGLLYEGFEWRLSTDKSKVELMNNFTLAAGDRLLVVAHTNTK